MILLIRYRNITNGTPASETELLYWGGRQQYLVFRCKSFLFGMYMGEMTSLDGSINKGWVTPQEDVGSEKRKLSFPTCISTRDCQSTPFPSRISADLIRQRHWHYTDPTSSVKVKNVFRFYKSFINHSIPSYPFSVISGSVGITSLQSGTHLTLTRNGNGSRGVYVPTIVHTNMKEKTTYKVRHIRMSDETWKQLMEKRKKSGKSWNLYLMRLMDKRDLKK